MTAPVCRRCGDEQSSSSGVGGSVTPVGGERQRWREEGSGSRGKASLMIGLLKGAGGLVPWLVIGGLLFAAFFIQPQPVGETVQPPPIERRDRFYGIEVLEEGQLLWAAGSDGKVVRSEDGGQTWAVQVTPTRENLQDIAAWDAERAVIVGNEGIVLVTSDAGATWEEVDAPRSEVFNKLIRVKVRPGGVAWAVGAMNAVFVSRDHGRSWQRAVAEEDITWNDIAFVDERGIWVVGEFGLLLNSPDGGESWEEVNVGLESSLMAVAFRDGGEGVAVGLEGTILVTRNGGGDWTRVETAFDEHLFDVTWNGTRWISVGDDGAVVRSGEGNSASWVADRLAPDLREWHTTSAANGDAVYISGATFGRLTDGGWHSFTEHSGGRK